MRVLRYNSRRNNRPHVDGNVSRAEADQSLVSFVSSLAGRGSSYILGPCRQSYKCRTRVTIVCL